MEFARTALFATAIISFAVSAFSGFLIVPALRRLKFGQTIKEIGPNWHKDKNGTPTMGGFMFYIGSLVGMLAGYGLLFFDLPELMGDLYSKQAITLYICALTSYAFGFIGFLDDYIKVVKKRNLGLKAIQKIIMQILVTAGMLISFYANGDITTLVQLPFIGTIDLGIFFYPLAFIIIIGMVNAVNLTDGIDGLASTVTFIAMLGFVFISSVFGNITVAVFATAIAGGTAGFLSWNFYPAKTFMGDTGSMFLGGAVVSAGFALGRIDLLLLIGLLYIFEALSVMLQVGYFKLTKGKRIFKMSPIHHHFEMSGWSEIKIVCVFGFFTLLCVVIAGIYVYTA